MRRSVRLVSLSLIVLLGLLAAGCSSQSASSGGAPDKVKLQLKWVPQSQFAGYLVAQAKGYYKAENLDVQILPGGPDIVSEQQVANGAADIGVDWVASLLASQDKGLPLVEIAQIYQTSGLLTIAKTKSGIKSPTDLKGKKVGVWFGGNEFEFLALMDKYHLNPDTDLQVIKQGFTMDPFVADQMDAAAAMTYNEYWVTIDAGVKPEDLVVIDYNREGVGMLEDNLFANKTWLASHKDAAIRFVRASLKGWRDAIQNVEEGTKYVMQAVAQGSTTETHQKRMLQEVAKLVLPQGMTPDKIGSIDAASFQRTADIAYKFKLLSKPADLKNAYTTEIITAAQKG